MKINRVFVCIIWIHLNLIPDSQAAPLLTSEITDVTKFSEYCNGNLMGDAWAERPQLRLTLECFKNGIIDLISSSPAYNDADINKLTATIDKINEDGYGAFSAIYGNNMGTSSISYPSHDINEFLERGLYQVANTINNLGFNPGSPGTYCESRDLKYNQNKYEKSAEIVSASSVIDKCTKYELTEYDEPSPNEEQY
ncbi:MAG: hypothetical protein HQL51_10530 [Magnetococcales bacterium]|nr:hypothetical protein [Magnetococcales bacterium]